MTVAELRLLLEPLPPDAEVGFVLDDASIDGGITDVYLEDQESAILLVEPQWWDEKQHYEGPPGDDTNHGRELHRKGEWEDAEEVWNEQLTGA